jgi:hypothetical protein
MCSPVKKSVQVKPLTREHPLFAERGLLQEILILANNLPAAATNRKFWQENAIQRKWRNFTWDPMPLVSSALSSDQPNPKSSKEAEALQKKLVPWSAIKMPSTMAFYPSTLELLEESLQLDSSRSLLAIWKVLSAKLRNAPKLEDSGAIRNWFLTNPAELAEVNDLDLKDLDLKILPLEFCSAAFTNLKRLNLARNQLKALPYNFGREWKKLQWISLDDNLLEALPNDFAWYWPQLTSLWISSNKLKSLPDTLGKNNPMLRWILADHNSLESVPAGLNKMQKRNFGIRKNPVEISILPPEFFTAKKVGKQKVQKGRECATTHLLSTLALTAFAAYAINWKAAVAGCALYLIKRYWSTYP